MYADDSTMFCAASTCNELNEALSNELKYVSDWVEHNKLILNVAKTKCIIFGTKRMLARNSYLDLSLGGTLIQQVKKIKLLGVIIDDHLTW